MKSKGAFLGFFHDIARGRRMPGSAALFGPAGRKRLRAFGAGGAAFGRLSDASARAAGENRDAPAAARPGAGRGIPCAGPGGSWAFPSSARGLTRLGQYQTWNALAMLLAILAGLVFFMQGCLFAADGQNFAAQHPKVSLLPVFWCLWNLAVQVRVCVEAFSVQSLLVGVLFLYLSFSFLAFAQMAAGSRAVTRGAARGLEPGGHRVGRGGVCRGRVRGAAGARFRHAAAGEPPGGGFVRRVLVRVAFIGPPGDKGGARRRARGRRGAECAPRRDDGPARDVRPAAACGAAARRRVARGSARAHAVGNRSAHRARAGALSAAGVGRKMLFLPKNTSKSQESVA